MASEPIRVTLDHCVVHVSDWDRSNAFYRTVLGARWCHSAPGSPTASAARSSTCRARRRRRTGGATAGAARRQRSLLRLAGHRRRRRGCRALRGGGGAGAGGPLRRQGPRPQRLFPRPGRLAPGAHRLRGPVMLNTVRKLVEGTPVERGLVGLYAVPVAIGPLRPAGDGGDAACCGRTPTAWMSARTGAPSCARSWPWHPRATTTRSSLCLGWPRSCAAAFRRHRVRGCGVGRGGGDQFPPCDGDPGISGMRPTVLVTPAMAVETLTVKTARLDELVAPAQDRPGQGRRRGAELLVFRGARAAGPRPAVHRVRMRCRDRRPLRGGCGPDLPVCSRSWATR